MSKGSLSTEENCQLVNTKGLRKIRCSFWMEVGIRWGNNPMFFTVTSIFLLQSAVVLINLFSSRLRNLLECCRLMFILFTGRICDLKSCLEWLKNCLLNISGYWYESGLGGLEFLSSEWTKKYAALIALSEETHSWFPTRWLALGKIES